MGTVEEDVLLFVRRQSINVMSLSSFKYQAVPVSGIKNAIAIDFDPLEKQIYWTDGEEQSINRVHLDGTGELFKYPLSSIDMYYNII